MDVASESKQAVMHLAAIDHNGVIEAKDLDDSMIDKMVVEAEKSLR